MANPVQQFEITPLVPLEISGYDISFTNSSLWMAFALIISTLYFTISMRKKSLVPSRAQAFSEMAYEMVANMIRENIGSRGRQYFPLIFTLFMLVLLGNVLGLLPYSFTYTSHIIVTAALALMIFFMVIVIGIYRHGLHFFGLFLPPGVPILMLPLIVPIEIMSFIIRPITLSVRLFANMVAGHIMIKVIAGFSVMMASIGTIGVLAGIIPMMFNSVIIGFELLIAALQAYVFAILSCVYLKDTIEINH